MPEYEYVVFRVPDGIPSEYLSPAYFGQFVARGRASEVALAILVAENPHGAFSPPRVETADEPVWANELDSE